MMTSDWTDFSFDDFDWSFGTSNGTVGSGASGFPITVDGTPSGTSVVNTAVQGTGGATNSGSLSDILNGFSSIVTALGGAVRTYNTATGSGTVPSGAGQITPAAVASQRAQQNTALLLLLAAGAAFYLMS
jgi:hypothetical protein